jgi:hypothetical protein
MRDPDLRSLRKTYAAALETFLAGAGEESLARAYDLGRGALGGGVGVLGLIAVHEEAVAALVRGQRISAAGARLLSASGTFLAESLSPFEMTHRGYEEVVVALRSMNQRLEDEARRIAHALHDDAGWRPQPPACRRARAPASIGCAASWTRSSATCAACRTSSAPRFSTTWGSCPQSNSSRGASPSAPASRSA